MKKTKTTNKLTKVSIPQGKERSTQKLPFNGELARNNSFVFSFSTFDRSHEYFNLGDNNHKNTIKGSWLISFLDCLKGICNLTIPELKGGTYDLHPVDWGETNAQKPDNADQLEFWQFRLDKSHGRVIGIKIDNIFYVVWLDPHHNLTDSEGYRTATKYKPGLSDYEIVLNENQCLKKEIIKLKEDYNTICELHDELKDFKK